MSPKPAAKADSSSCRKDKETQPDSAPTEF